ncbi:hypothetical protein SPONL_772 [uncultured Candidatus Thioglobus sp.]|nr:hypothetical protein SPONL_772 [uncultured Candidatus Thioglobus sp.]
MFKCNELIYIQIQKTACTHIAALLTQLFDGNIIGKHNRASLTEINTTPYFIASMRNPWDWYLSLWTFGVSKRGGLHERLTQKRWQDLIRSISKNPKNTLQYCLQFLQKDTQKWQAVYQSNTDIAAFRQWLKQIHQPGNDLGEGYIESGMSQSIGFMSYRYFSLCCQIERWPKMANASLTELDTLKQLDQQYCYIDDFVRQENLENSLIEVLNKVRPLSSQEKLLIQNSQKTNASLRAFTLNDYYDQYSVDLIANRDKLLIEKFNYQPPEL